MKDYQGRKCICVLMLEDRIREIKIGDLVSFSDGRTATVASLTPPHKACSTGRMYVRQKGFDFTQGYFPNVFNCKFMVGGGS